MSVVAEHCGSVKLGVSSEVGYTAAALKATQQQPSKLHSSSPYSNTAAALKATQQQLSMSASTVRASDSSELGAVHTS